MRLSHPLPMDDINSLTGVGYTGRAALLLAQYLPALCFASPTRLPALLEPLYSPAGVRDLHSLSVELDIFFESLFFPARSPEDIALNNHAAAVRASASAGGVRRPPPGSVREYGSFKEFDRLCSVSGLSPHVLSPTVVQLTCEMVLGITLQDSAADLLVCKNDWIEVLFVLAQISFDHTSAGHTATETKTGDFTGTHPPVRGEPMRKLSDLLRCFRSLAYLPHVMGRLRKGGGSRLRPAVA